MARLPIPERCCHDSSTHLLFHPQLQEVLKPFEKASCLGSGGGAPHADLGLLAFLAGCAASVPLRRADEPLGLLAAINSIGGWPSGFSCHPFTFQRRWPWR